MSILYVNLEKNEIRTEKDRPENGYALLKALMDERKDRIAFTSINGDALRIKGASSALFAFNSPLKGRVDYGYAPLYLSFMLFSFGYTALVIEGKAERYCYLSLRGDRIELKEIERGLRYDEFRKRVSLKSDDVVLASGLAADEKIRIAALYENGREIGRSFGSAFSILNFKGICLQRYLPPRREDEEGKKYRKEISEAELGVKLKRESSSSYVKYLERNGSLAIDNFSKRRDARAIFLDGCYLKEKYGAYSSSCLDCPVLCRRVLKDRSPSPDLIDVIAFGSLQGIFSSEKVLSIKKAVYDKGLDSIEAGAMLASLDLSADGKAEYARGYDGSDYQSYKVGNCSVIFDPRGMGESAVFLSLGDTFLPYFSIYHKKRIKGEGINAVLALYERAFTYALSSRSLPVLGSYIAYISKIPEFCYLSPRLLKWKLEKEEMFGIKARDLLKEGLEIINMLGECDFPFPDHFIYSSSSHDDSSTLRLTRLMGCYRKEKRELEHKLFKREAKRKR